MKSKNQLNGHTTSASRSSVFYGKLPDKTSNAEFFIYRPSFTAQIIRAAFVEACLPYSNTRAAGTLTEKLNEQLTELSTRFSKYQKAVRPLADHPA